MSIAIFPGSFDPITKGHLDIVKRALPLFDKVIIAIGHNTHKSYLFPLEKRLEWIHTIYKDEPRVEVKSYEGLTYNFCKEMGATYLLRGLRSSADLEYEQPIAQMNRQIGGVETIFLVAAPEYASFSSTIARDLIKHGGNARPFLPDEVVF